MRSKWIRRLPLFLWAAGLFLPSCEKPKKPLRESDQEVARNVQVPIFHADSAFRFVEEQLAFGPRIPNSVGHQKCREYLSGKLTTYGAAVVIQEFQEKAFDGTLLQLSNIVASYHPSNTKRILLAAHWDTRPWADKDSLAVDEPIEGANDNASGVAVLLEIARQLSQSAPPEVGVDLIFFDGEDYGVRRGYQGSVIDQHGGWCLGSRYWAGHKHIPRYSAYFGILLDMVGARDAKFFQEGASMQYAPSVIRKVWGHAGKIGFTSYFVPSVRPAITDDHIFLNEIAGIPTIDIVHFDPTANDYFGPTHHTLGDNIDIIDSNTLLAVGQTVLYTLYYE